MPRKKQGKHTCPENAGEQNFTPEYMETHKADELTRSILERTEILLANRQNYQSAWTPEALQEAVDNYFQKSRELGLEVAKVGLALYLGMTRQHLGAIANDPTKYGVKSSIVNSAFEQMEFTYFNKLDSRPVPSMFKLKTQNNYVENQKLEIVADAKVSADEIKDKIAGLLSE